MRWLHVGNGTLVNFSQIVMVRRLDENQSELTVSTGTTMDKIRLNIPFETLEDRLMEAAASADQPRRTSNVNNTGVLEQLTKYHMIPVPG